MGIGDRVALKEDHMTQGVIIDTIRRNTIDPVTGEYNDCAKIICYKGKYFRNFVWYNMKDLILIEE